MRQCVRLSPVVLRVRPIVRMGTVVRVRAPSKEEECRCCGRGTYVRVRAPSREEECRCSGRGEWGGPTMARVRKRGGVQVQWTRRMGRTNHGLRPEEIDRFAVWGAATLQQRGSHIAPCVSRE